MAVGTAERLLLRRGLTTTPSTERTLIMTDLNYVVLTGRLTRDPIVRRGETGTVFAYFTVATNRFYKDKTGGFQQETAFVPCIVFGRWAEMVSKRMKGELVVAAGRLRTDVWEQDAEKRSQLTLVCDSVRSFAAAHGTVAGISPEEDGMPVGGNEMSEQVKSSVPF